MAEHLPGGSNTYGWWKCRKCGYSLYAKRVQRDLTCVGGPADRHAEMEMELEEAPTIRAERDRYRNLLWRLVYDDPIDLAALIGEAREALDG